MDLTPNQSLQSPMRNDGKDRHSSSEQKQAEERLRHSEKHFRALIENNADGIALTDENGIITYASPSTTRMVGYLPEEIVGGRIFGREDYPDGGEATRRLMARRLAEPR